ncbi:hypothetical protein GIB67_005106 [Kingdonia uniflora]|uniref:DUF659 domain-containing protein n=1 Tax=Kingdonia uniflora TaxID=39325 RepID=A0A7J7PDS0_9MAGN|nr:hypothetical protein GIB67_005106 [Kingdonia uniflora]
MLGCMEEVGKQLAEKRRNIFWTVCASHCICLMLEKFETMSPIKEVMIKAKIITKLLYNRETVLKLNEATQVLKVTIPLVRALHLVNEGDSKPQIGYIYETIDQVKEIIKEEFENKKVSYMSCWNILDKIWNNILHRPIHAAGYFLNPSLFYYDDFVVDAEVAGGLLCCIVRIVEDKKIQDLILQQLDEYREAKSPFGWINAVDQKSEIPPKKWWSLYGKNLSEELHKIGRNNLEQQHLLDITLVHHNLRLRDCESNAKEGDGNSDKMIDPMDD